MSTGRTQLFRLTTRALKMATFEASATRRGFLGAAVGAGGLLLARSLQAQEATETPKAPEPAKPAKPAVPVTKGPVAIVGGGMAGLTAAYQLSNAGVECHLYEANERLGGRMFTKRNFNDDGMFVELGGELVDSHHKQLMDFAKEVKVEMQSLREGETGIDYYHYNGKLLTDKELVPLFAPLAKRIAADADGLQDAEGNFTDKAKKLDAISLATYLQQIGASTEKWVIQLLSIAYTIEYGLEPEEQSALNFIDFIGTALDNGFQMFGESDEAWRIKGGNDTLPTAVYEAIKSKIQTSRGAKLVKISQSGADLSLTFLTGKKVETKIYSHVILTIPFTTLREVEGIYNLPLSEEKIKAIKEMGYGANAKVMVGFKGRLWRNPRGADKTLCNGSIYSDLPFQNVWETSRGQDGKSGVLTNFLGGKAAAQFTADRFDKLLAELDQIIPGIKADADGKKVMMNWPSVKWIKASYSSYAVGQYTWIGAAAAATELNGHLLFAGEHTSEDFAGYMNGAVESGQRVAGELLGKVEADTKEESREPSEPKPAEEAAKPAN